MPISEFLQADDYTKMEFDLFKHLTTLSTGAIVILATFLNRFVAQQICAGTDFLIAGIVSFCVCIVSAAFGMSMIIGGERATARFFLRKLDQIPPSTCESAEAIKAWLDDEWRRDMKMTIFFVVHRMIIRISAFFFLLGIIMIVAFIIGNLQCEAQAPLCLTTE